MKHKIIKKIPIFSFLFIIITLILNFNIIKSQDDDDDENPLFYIHFDMSDPDIIIVNKNKDEPTPEIKDIISKSSSVRLPNVELDKEDYFFSGWTEDGIYGFLPGDAFVCHSKNITLKPVFGLLADKRTFTLEYIVEFEGEIIETDLSKGHYCKNRIVTTSLKSFPQTTATHRGWTDGKNEFAQEQKLVMPEHNVTLKAIFYYYRNLTYVPGDVDGIVGQEYDIQTIRAGGDKQLAESTRLNRKGYVMVGWHCENDGKDYPFFYSYIMPDENVIMTAIWEPITYNIVFISGISSIPNIKISGQTGKKIIAPYLNNIREGYKFIGWSIYDSEVYYPGDEIVVKGQMPGFGITSKAIWALNQ